MDCVSVPVDNPRAFRHAQKMTVNQNGIEQNVLAGTLSYALG